MNNPVERGRKHATNGKREAADGYVIVEKLQVELRERRLRNTWRPKPFLAPAPGFENPAGRVFSDREIILALVGLVRAPSVRTKLLEELQQLPSEAEPVPSQLSALDRAIAAIKATPDKSNRLIAKENGIAEPTVRRARHEMSRHDAVADAVARVGADGRRRKLPKAANDDRDEPEPGSARVAFALRADAAWQLANYPIPINEVDEDCRKIVEAAAKSWADLAQKLRR